MRLLNLFRMRRENISNYCIIAYVILMSAFKVLGFDRVDKVYYLVGTAASDC